MAIDPAVQVEVILQGIFIGSCVCALPTPGYCYWPLYLHVAFFGLSASFSAVHYVKQYSGHSTEALSSTSRSS
jgi:hypothetical protein